MNDKISLLERVQPTEAELEAFHRIFLNCSEDVLDRTPHLIMARRAVAAGFFTDEMRDEVSVEA